MPGGACATPGCGMGGMGSGGAMGGGNMGGAMGGGMGSMGGGLGGGGGGAGGGGMGMAPLMPMGAAPARPAAQNMAEFDPMAMLNQSSGGPKKLAAAKAPASDWDNW